MAYPTSLDSFTSPTATQKLNAPSHSTIETAQNTALAALETKMGIDSSADTTTIDYKLKSASSSNPGHVHTTSNITDFTSASTSLINTLVSVPTGQMVAYGGRTAPTNWLLCDGSLVSRTTYATLFGIIAPANTVSITIATPAVLTATAHGLVLGDKVSFTTTSALPTGIVVNTDYFVISAGLTANAFEISATRGGAAINTSGSQSGTHTVYATNYGKGNGSTTFTLPDMRGFTPYGFKSGDTAFDVLSSPSAYVGEKTHVLLTAELASHTHTYAPSGGGGGTATYANGAQQNPTNVATGSAGSDTAHNNMPPYVVFNFIIKT